MRTSTAVVCLAATAVPAAMAFAPGMGTNAIAYSQRSAQASCLAHRSKGALSLRAADDRFERPDLTPDRKIKLGTTQTSWQGWGSSTVDRKKELIKVDANDPKKAVKEALKQAREFEDIAKYLGTTESKQRAGITGDVEFVSLEKDALVLRLVGNFWHNRQMVFGEVSDFIKQALPSGTVQTVTIEDPAQLQGFAETSNAFKDAKKITDDDLRAKEAKGVNIYGEKLEGPAAEFRRKKLANQAKYEEMVSKERELSQKSDGEQISQILQDEGLAGMFGGGTATAVRSSDDNLRPEDILKSMM